MVNGKKYKKRSTETKRNSPIPFLKAAVIKMKVMLFSTLVTVRQD